MAAQPLSGPISLRLTGEMARALEAHLFPGDDDEHGAVIGAAVVATARGVRLLGSRLFLAKDGVDYVPGRRGYRMLTASFVRDCALACAEEQLAYLAVHCHRGRDSVAFSADDLASHERGYPALLDILDGPPAGGLVAAHDALAGDIWLRDGSRVVLKESTVTERPIRRLHAAPLPRPIHADERFDRQARLFGDRGQALLAQQKVAVVGAGGAGSLIIEYLARLGVGELVIIDPDRIAPSNMSRVVGARRRDLRPLLTHPRMPARVRAFGKRHRTYKVAIAERVAREAQPGIAYHGYASDVTSAHAAERLVDCDYVFLAADSMQARLLVNAVVHQYLIPGVQVGAKVRVDKVSGQLLDVFSVVRSLIPGESCLWCNELISASGLQEEATAADQRVRQRYVEEAEIVAPSVITLNAVAASHAVNDYLFALTGLRERGPLYWSKFFPLTGEMAPEIPRRDPDCGQCFARVRLAAGRRRRLPVRSR